MPRGSWQVRMQLKVVLGWATMAVIFVTAWGYIPQLNAPVTNCSDKILPEPELSLDFYSNSCPKATKKIAKMIRKAVKNDTSLPAGLIRLQFHDCFVRGCDASVLLTSTNGSASELEAVPNDFLRGIEVLDHIKKTVEKMCPGVVSCADILALAARDSLHAIRGPSFKVPLGRRDGFISLQVEASRLPSPFQNFTALLDAFVKLGLNAKDLVALSGAHSIGFAHCRFLVGRLYNFSGRGVDAFDPSLDAAFVAQMRKKCPQNQTQIVIEMDPTGPLPGQTFDSHYFRNVLMKRGLFTSDSALLTDPESLSHVIELASPKQGIFFEAFGESMEKMGKIGVLTGSQGEIRRKCAFVNEF